MCENDEDGSGVEVGIDEAELDLRVGVVTDEDEERTIAVEEAELEDELVDAVDLVVEEVGKEDEDEVGVEEEDTVSVTTTVTVFGVLDSACTIEIAVLVASTVVMVAVDTTSVSVAVTVAVSVFVVAAAVLPSTLTTE